MASDIVIAFVNASVTVRAMQKFVVADFSPKGKAPSRHWH